MHRSFYLSLSFLIASITAFAEILTPQQALERAFDGNKHLKTSMTKASNDLKLVKTVDINSTPAIYLFSGQEAQTFYVISADDQTDAILAYGDSQITDSQLPPAFVDWLDDYADQIAWLRENQSEATYLVNKTSRQPIAPLVTTKWNQSTPYNNKCPMDGSDRSVTGCVATAMAQVMNYHKWPANGTGSNSYTLNNKTISLDFSTITFDWKNMLDSYNGNSDALVSRNAVANLMYACGVSVNMNYSSSASGAVTSKVATALATYFDYDKGATFLSREFYGISEWEDMVYEQLEKYGPVQYSGRNNEGGHSFVCDGYSSDGFFHINWGWGGTSDGYFKLTALDPASQGIGGSSAGYNISQGIVANVCRSGAGNGISPNFTCNGEFIITPTSASLGSSVTVQGGFYNYASSSMSITAGLRLTASNGKETIINGPSSTLKPNYGWSKFSVILPRTLAAGTYRVEPVFKTSDGIWQRVPIKITYPQYLILTVSGSSVSIASGERPSVTVGDIDCLTPFYIGSEYIVETTVKNDGNSEFFGYIASTILDPSTLQPLAYGPSVQIDLLGGEETLLKYVGTFETEGVVTLSSGNYIFAFYDTSTGKILSTTEITLHDKPEKTILSAGDISVAGAPSFINCNNFQVSVDVTCEKGYFAGSLRGYLFYGTGGTSLKGFYSEPFFLEESMISKVMFNMTYPEADFSKTYMVAVRNHDNTSWIAQSSAFKFNKTADVDAIDTDNEIDNIEIYTLSGINMTGLDLPSGIYVVRTTYKNGTIDTRRVAVK